jgi:hypothetical protein
MTLLLRDASGQADFDLFPYNPSAGAGYAFLVMFGIMAAAHIVLMVMYRSWYFIPFVLGCIGKQKNWTLSNLLGRSLTHS